MEKDIQDLINQLGEAMMLLKDKGIIRSNSFICDLGEYYCSKKYCIELNENKNTKGYDGLDRDGKKVQIKTRCGRTATRIPFTNLSFDYCIIVYLDPTYTPIEFYKMDRQTVKDNLLQDKDGQFFLTMGKVRKLANTK